jgi:hypothetical protein
MELCHSDIILHSAAAKQLAEFIQQQRKKWTEQETGMHNFESFEQELHKLVMALECELLREELGHYDVSAEEIVVEKKTYRRGRCSSETYLTAAGCVRVARHLYHGVEPQDKSVCPLELGSGMIAGYFTPRAARLGAFGMAHLTSGESEAMFGEIGNMQPSRSSLDRLTKVLSPHWESKRSDWEAQLRQQEPVPVHATVLAISVDGVMAPLRGADKQEKAEQPGKHASGPIGYKEVGCGTVNLYDQEAQRLQTVRYARMPESRKVSLQQQLETEVASILALKPDLLRVHLADGAKDNWRLMNEIEAHLPETHQKIIEIVDYYHACDHLKRGCDAAWGESTPESKEYFDRLKTKLKETENGAKLIMRVLRFQSSTAKGNRRKRLEAELTYFRNQQERMHYLDYMRCNLPIASGVMEASCKTLVTQRMKRSGMTWEKEGGQAILTLRSLIQSNRWPSAWALLSADFHATIKLSKPHRSKDISANQTPLRVLPCPKPVQLFDRSLLPLAV